MSSQAVSDEVIEQLSRWFKARVTSCHFASKAVQNARTQVFESGVTPDLPAFFNALMLAAATQGQLAVSIFPSIEREETVADLAERLRSSVCSCELEQDTADSFLVDLRWKKPNGSAPPSSLIGFGPFGSMPLTRRAPFVVLAAWPRRHENTMRKKPKQDQVGVGDMQHAFEKAAYDEMFKKTRDDLKATQALPGGQHRTESVTFRLPMRVRSAMG